jgi:hypothetical protein
LVFLGLVLLGAGGAAVTIPTAALILGKAAIIGAGQDRTFLNTYIIILTVKKGLSARNLSKSYLSCHKKLKLKI